MCAKMVKKKKRRQRRGGFQEMVQSRVNRICYGSDGRVRERKVSRKTQKKKNAQVFIVSN